MRGEPRKYNKPQSAPVQTWNNLAWNDGNKLGGSSRKRRSKKRRSSKTKRLRKTRRSSKIRRKTRKRLKYFFLKMKKYN